MIEVFSGTATLTSVAKQFGMKSSMALDKVRKKGARATIYVFDLLDPKDRELLYHWMESGLLVWVHLAPVCGTCSRARQIKNGGPPPLRSEEHPMGLPGLDANQQLRVDLANAMYVESCKIFSHCVAKGILATLENPKRSLFWLTAPFVQLLEEHQVYFSDSQMCMLGGQRPKWTRLAASFEAVSEMNVECDKNHVHLPWGKTLNAEGLEVFATSLEAEYPRKFCISLVQCVLRQLQRQNMAVAPEALFDIKDSRAHEMQTARVTAQQQPRRTKLPPLIPDSFAVGVFYVHSAADIASPLQSKLKQEQRVFTKTGEEVFIPANARFLRRSAVTSPFSTTGGVKVGDECFEVAFGLPWNFETFLRKATELGHPANFCKRVPTDIQEALDFHSAHTFAEVSEHRLSWCKSWLKRAAQLDKDEKTKAAARHPSTAGKRVQLTKEILESLEYEDLGVLDLLESGSPLAGEVEASCVFQPGYRPCVTTLGQLEEDAYKRNQLVLGMTKSSGSHDLDSAVLKETMEELEKGWADGPWPLEALEQGATISRRFPLQQGDKIRMIDDYSISGVNDSCTLNSKLDLHVVDTFVATIKAFFQAMDAAGRETLVLAKTYDLKSAYRQVPILTSHLKFAYFCIYNPEKMAVEIYRSRTLPFGATHSVFSFLRLARMIHCIATRGAKLITTNFYDDFILASPPALQDSARNCMELIFLLTGWEFAKEGRKATEFSEVCHALGVSFDLRDACNGVLKVQNTQKRIDELVEFLTQVRERRRLDRGETLKLRGRLGFADGFLHGRLGALILKRLIDHAYGSTSLLDDSMTNVLGWMIKRLQTAGPKKVDSGTVREWCVFTDASFEPDEKRAGLGGVLVDSTGECIAWFGLKLGEDACNVLGADVKETIIYELELLAACVALELWAPYLSSSYPVHYGDNDSVRFALIRGVAQGVVAETIMQFHLEVEVSFNSNIWFARVPTEANIADLPSRSLDHSFLASHSNVNNDAMISLEKFLDRVSGARRSFKRSGVGEQQRRPHVVKRKT